MPPKQTSMPTFEHNGANYLTENKLSDIILKSKNIALLLLYFVTDLKNNHHNIGDD
tara:strand:- start:60 stop:227 length:168 start_codon:yes stop_codon:yes gene_type:complete